MAITHTEAVQLMDDLHKGSNLFGALSPEVRARLFNVVDKPSQDTWNDAHSIILTGSPVTTLWQALLAHTDYDVTSGPAHAPGQTPGPWPKLPTSEQLLIAIRAELTSAGPHPTHQEPSMNESHPSYAPTHPLPDWLTPGQRRTIEHFQAYNVPTEWFMNPPNQQGRVTVVALGHDTDAGSDAEGFIWSLTIEPDGSYGASEATVGPWENGITI